jgi:hypothetical protein
MELSKHFSIVPPNIVGLSAIAHTVAYKLSGYLLLIGSVQYETAGPIEGPENRGFGGGKGRKICSQEHGWDACMLSVGVCASAIPS